MAEELWQGYPSLVSEWVDFEASRVAQNRSPKTIKKYREEYTTFWNHHITDLGITERSEVTRKVIRQWIRWMQTRPARRGGTLSPTTVEIAYRHVHAIFEYLTDEDIEDGDEDALSPFHKVPKPTAKVADPEVMTDDEVAAMIATTRPKGGSRSYLDIRDEAIIRTFHTIGIRSGENETIYLKDVDLSRGWVTVRGKTGERTVVLRPVALRALNRYMRERARKNPTHDALWVNRWGAPLTASGVRQALKKRARQANITRRVWPHLLRHTWAHEYRMNGGDEDTQQYLGGWSSRTMLARYGRSAQAERARRKQAQVAVGDKT